MNYLEEKNTALANHLGLFNLNGIVSNESESDIKDMFKTCGTELEFEDWFDLHDDLHFEFDFNSDKITVEYEGREYLVCTDEEADELHDEHLEWYIDECILPELHKAYRNYFDRESWKDDQGYDGRGGCLAGYDGCENEEKVNSTTYYIYRTN